MNTLYYKNAKNLLYKFEPYCRVKISCHFLSFNMQDQTSYFAMNLYVIVKDIRIATSICS